MCITLNSLNEIYLSSELKKFYFQDFEKLLSSEMDFWQIDETIKNHLIKLNQNENIQTLYSKYGPGDNMLGSYIEFCYTEKIEQRIFKDIIPEILYEFNDIRSGCCIYEFSYPRDNANFNGDRKLGFSCTDNPDHFRINNIKIIYRSYGLEHIPFWDLITEKLSNL
jgi:hypothetical protein